MKTSIVIFITLVTLFAVISWTEATNELHSDGVNGRSAMLDVTCPPMEQNDRDILIANPYDCNTYYHCNHEVPYLQICPEGLHFNDEAQACDWPEYAECKEEAHDKEPECPAVVENPGEDIYLPHESDCTKFYKCSHGIPYVMDCPDGLYWSSKQNTCDWPQNVECKNKKNLENTTLADFHGNQLDIDN